MHRSDAQGRRGHRTGAFTPVSFTGFLFSDAFDKGLTFKRGKPHVQHFLPKLLERIEHNDISLETIINHRMSLEDAAIGYKVFDKKEETAATSFCPLANRDGGGRYLVCRRHSDDRDLAQSMDGW
jgi:threonine dehydrogenase-like Zn-dependent dehydrogenase